MHLAKLVIKNFRKLEHAELISQAGLNVLVGGNNVGKTAVVDALRALLAGHEDAIAARAGPIANETMVPPVRMSSQV